MRKAFTLIELLVAVAIVGILATLVTVNFTGARKSSRDARRQTDVKSYTAAVEKYRISNTSYFITDTGGCGAAGSTPSALVSGCTGVDGASYGRMNFKSSTEAEKSYAATTIAQALLNQGLVDKIAKDPSNIKNDSTPDQPDYVFIRCEKNGSQALGREDAGFAIWTQLEKKPNLVSAETTTTSCGGSLTNFTGSFGSTKLAAVVASGSDAATSAELSAGYFAAGSGRMSIPVPASRPAQQSAFTVVLTAIPNNDPAPISTNVTATVTQAVGDPLQDLAYVFYCDISNQSSSYSIPASASTSQTTSCSYPVGGTKTAKVVVSGGGVSAEGTVEIVVKPALPGTLSVSLLATPQSIDYASPNQPFVPTLTASISGTASAPYSYTFTCGNDTTGQVVSTPMTSVSSTACKYTSFGSNTVLVTVFATGDETPHKAWTTVKTTGNAAACMYRENRNQPTSHPRSVSRLRSNGAVRDVAVHVNGCMGATVMRGVNIVGGDLYANYGLAGYSNGVSFDKNIKTTGTIVGSNINSSSSSDVLSRIWAINVPPKADTLVFPSFNFDYYKDNNSNNGTLSSAGVQTGYDHYNFSGPVTYINGDLHLDSLCKPTITCHVSVNGMLIVSGNISFTNSEIIVSDPGNGKSGIFVKGSMKGNSIKQMSIDGLLYVDGDMQFTNFGKSWTKSKVNGGVFVGGNWGNTGLESVTITYNSNRINATLGFR